MRDLITIIEGLNEATDNMSEELNRQIEGGGSFWIAKVPGDGTVTRVENTLNHVEGLNTFRILTSKLGQWSGTANGGVDIDVTKFNEPTALLIDVDSPINRETAIALAKAYDESRGTQVRLVMVSPPGSVSDYPPLMSRFGKPINF